VFSDPPLHGGENGRESFVENLLLWRPEKFGTLEPHPDAAGDVFEEVMLG
jgi:hypothetical protein